VHDPIDRVTDDQCPEVRQVVQRGPNLERTDPRFSVAKALAVRSGSRFGRICTLVPSLIPEAQPATRPAGCSPPENRPPQ
jgi:hypothetical protein